MTKIRRGQLQLGPMKRGPNATLDRRGMAKIVEAHRTGRVDAFSTPEGLRLVAVPRKVRKARATRKAQRLARKAERRSRK